MDVDNEYGVLFIAFGKCLFALSDANASDLLTGAKIPDIKNSMMFYKKFDGLVKYIKLTSQNLVLNIESKIKVFNRERFIASDGQESAFIEFDLNL